MEWFIKFFGYKLESEPKNIADAMARIARLNDFINSLKAKAEAEAAVQRERAERFLKVADKRERRAAKANTIVTGLTGMLADHVSIADDDED